MNRNIKTAFPWHYSRTYSSGITYQELAKRQYNSQHPKYPFYLQSPANALPMFQFFIPSGLFHTGDLNITQFLAVDATNPSHTVDMATEIYLIQPFQVAGTGLWWIYLGEDWDQTSIPDGVWYLAIELGGVRWVVSEQFKVCAFLDDKSKTYMEWWHAGDTAGIIYQTGFKNQLWLDGRPEMVDPQIFEEGVENGNKEFVQTFAAYVNQYQWTDVLPEYLVEALAAIRLHNNKRITNYSLLEDHEEYFELKEVRPTWEEGQAMALVTMKLEQLQRFYSSGCPANEVQSALIPLVANNDTYNLSLPLASIVSVTSPTVLANDQGWNLHAVAGTLATSEGSDAHMNSNGTFTWELPYPGFTGTDSFVYTVEDGLGNTDTATVTINVAP